MDALKEMALEAYDRAIGLDLSDVAVDCCITKAPCGGEKAGRSPVDRGKRGIKRSMIVDGEETSLSERWRPQRTATIRRFWLPRWMPWRRWEGCPSR